jgi:hypothetical protein
MLTAWRTLESDGERRRNKNDCSGQEGRVQILRSVPSVRGHGDIPVLFTTDLRFRNEGVWLVVK